MLFSEFKELYKENDDAFSCRASEVIESNLSAHAEFIMEGSRADYRIISALVDEPLELYLAEHYCGCDLDPVEIFEILDLENWDIESDEIQELIE